MGCASSAPVGPKGASSSTSGAAAGVELVLVVELVELELLVFVVVEPKAEKPTTATGMNSPNTRDVRWNSSRLPSTLAASTTALSPRRKAAVSPTVPPAVSVQSRCTWG